MMGGYRVGLILFCNNSLPKVLLLYIDRYASHSKMNKSIVRMVTLQKKTFSEVDKNNFQGLFFVLPLNQGFH